MRPLPTRSIALALMLLTLIVVAIFEVAPVRAAELRTAQEPLAPAQTVPTPTATGTATATPTPTATPTATGQIISGTVVPGGGIAIIVFGGGSSDQLVAASRCPTASVVFWVTDSSGGFTTFVPGTTIAVVNAAWNTRFAPGIPANTPLLVRCNAPNLGAAITTKTFTSATKNYSIDYPSDWTALPDFLSVGGINVDGFAPNGGFPNANVLCDPAGAGLSTAAYVTATRASMTSRGITATVGASITTKSGAATALTYTNPGSSGTAPFDVAQAFIADARCGWVITLAGQVGTLTQYMSLFAQMVASFKAS